MKKVLYVLLFLNYTTFGHGNDLTKSFFASVEAGGHGGYGSAGLTYLPKGIGWIKPTIRVGLSSYSLRDYEYKMNPSVILPIDLNFDLGDRHIFQIGASNTYVFTVNYERGIKKRTVSESLGFKVGYKLYNQSYKKYWALGFSPIYQNNDFLRSWYYVGLGFKIAQL